MHIELNRRLPGPAGTRLAALVAALTSLSVPCLGGDSSIALQMSNVTPEVVYDADRDHCDPIDTPDMPARAFRNASGDITMFTLHFVNRPLRGPDLAHMKIDCHVALASAGDADPSRYNDRRYVTATWTNDGKILGAVIHDEYHADQHHRCAIANYLGCWYNSLVGLVSKDSGQSFDAEHPVVIATAPFRADVEVGRHRGFFNPSNIVSDGRYYYFLAATTGWSGQPFGTCLFRSTDATNPESWRAWDGRSYNIHYSDPYRGLDAPKPCTIVGPFVYPVGGLVMHKPTNTWIGVWMASADQATFPVDGFYYATSPDLKIWSQPQLLRSGHTLLNAGCSGPIIAYPSLLDANASGRNFDNISDEASLFFTTITMHDCQTGNRQLVRIPVRVTSRPARELLH